MSEMVSGEGHTSSLLLQNSLILEQFFNSFSGKAISYLQSCQEFTRVTESYAQEFYLPLWSLGTHVDAKDRVPIFVPTA